MKRAVLVESILEELVRCPRLVGEVPELAGYTKIREGAISGAS